MRAPDDHDPDPGWELLRLAEVDAEREALQLRLTGCPYARIAGIQGVDVRTVRRRVTQALKEQVPTELRDEVRAMALFRLDTITERNMLIYLSPSSSDRERERAEDVLLRCERERLDITGARLAPADESGGSTLDAEIIALAEQLGRPIPPKIDVQPPDRSSDGSDEPTATRSSRDWSGRPSGSGEFTGNISPPDRDYGDPSVA